MTEEVASPDQPEHATALHETAPRQVEVEIVRSVKLTRLLIVGAVVGAIVVALITMMLPVAQDANYTMGQIVGFMLLIGAVLGLLLGAILGLILNRIARKKQGSGVAVQSDVQ